MQDNGASLLKPTGNGFQNFDHGATDTVLAAEFNSSGTHLAVCSADHKIRLFAAGPTDAWTLIDQWRGHDAEILDASCLYPSACRSY